MQSQILPPILVEAAKSSKIKLGGKTMHRSASKIETTDAYQFLRALPEFSAASNDDIKALADCSRVANLDAGQFITVEGDEEASSGFIVISGRMAMLKTSISGKELIVELLDSGDVFGLLLMLAGKRAQAQLSARAIQATRVLWVPTESFSRTLKSNPSVLREVITHLLICLQSSYKLSRGLAHDKVEVRIASILASLAAKFASRMPSDLPNTVHFTRQQLADLTGTTPETAIRVTRAMQRNKLIDIKRPGVIRILDLDALHAIVES